MKNRIKNSVSSVVKKPWILVVLVALFLLFAGILAITQEAGEDFALDDFPLDDMFAEFSGEGVEEAELPPAWEPLGPPRWFRSNAGGMTLEEIPSRLAALRNKYALVIDYVPPEEVEPRLAQYYQDEYIVEVRILYEQGSESRRQWLFRDESGAARLNAVFTPRPEKQIEETEVKPEESAAALIDNDIDKIDADGESDGLAAVFPPEISPDISPEISPEVAADISPEAPPESPPDDGTQPAVPAIRETPVSVGFIEIFNEKTQIIEERQFFDDDSEARILYFYNSDILIKAEAREKPPNEEFRDTYTDYYRYNRSYSLRHVERQFHAASSLQPIRLTFPGRVLDAAFDESFFNDKLAVISDFFDVFSADKGYRVIYHTDGKGRILTQTMLNDKDEEVWVIVNTWSGDRIVAMKKTEGEDEKVTEYEYNGEGDRITQRDIHNGVLERLVRSSGANETEELYMDGILVLKAYWVDGRKVSEERVRRR